MRYMLACSALWALYLALAGTLSASELVTGAIVAAVCTGWSALLRHCSPHRFQADITHLAPWGRSLRQLLPEALATGALLCRVVWRGGPVGSMRKQPFIPGRGGMAGTRARRASALLCASLAPARFIVRLHSAEAHALVHELYTQDEHRFSEAKKRWLI